MPILKDWCLAERWGGGDGVGRVLNWDEAGISAMRARLIAGTERGSYTEEQVAQVTDVLRDKRGTTGVVLGSDIPWVECIALNAEVEEVWTWEYSTIKSTVPRLRAAPMHVMAEGFASGSLPLMDWAVSFSSFEHSGLGRYGDPLNPEGDVEAMEDAWCMLRPGGTLALGVAMTCTNVGRTDFNAHRVYGYTRLAYISAGWEIDSFQGVGCQAGDGPQPIVIMRKPLNGERAPALSADDFASASAAAAARKK